MVNVIDRSIKILEAWLYAGLFCFYLKREKRQEG